jgi:hypothetical protein
MPFTLMRASTSSNRRRRISLLPGRREKAAGWFNDSNSSQDNSFPDHDATGFCGSYQDHEYSRRDLFRLADTRRQPFEAGSKLFSPRLFVTSK